MEKRVLAGQYNNAMQAQGLVNTLTDLGKAMGRPLRAEVETVYNVVATVNGPRAQTDLKLADKSGFICRRCGRHFGSLQARAMHNVRSHTKTWGTGENGKRGRTKKK